MRRLLGERRIGHCGTLDPLATGLLVLVVGESTRLAAHASAEFKRYRCTVELGLRTDSDDVDGTVLQRSDASAVSDQALQAALDTLSRSRSQVPPRYSALHVDGERSHQLARRGQSFDLPARPIEVRSLLLTDRRGGALDLELEVSAGTYVRALARDLGEILGCGAAVSALRRTAVGELVVEAARDLDAFAVDDPWACVLAPPLLFPASRRLEVDATTAAELWRNAWTDRVGSRPVGAAPWIAHTGTDVVGVVAPVPQGDRIRLLRGFPPPSQP